MSISIIHEESEMQTDVKPPPRADGVRRAFAEKTIDFSFTAFAWTMLVLVFAIGYKTGWKLPSFSMLLRKSVVAEVDWCKDHSVPASICIECKPTLLPKPKPTEFCMLHGVAECVFEHPERAQLPDDASLPKGLSKRMVFAAKNINSSREPLHKKRVQFASKESISRAGIDVGIVEVKPMAESISANAELIFDPTRVARLSTRVAGGVAATLKVTGDRVKAGEILAVIDAAEVGKAKSQFAQAAVQLKLKESVADRLRPIALQGAVPQKTAIEAETSLQEAIVAFSTARQALVNLGFDPPTRNENLDSMKLDQTLQKLGLEEYVERRLSTPLSSNLIPIRAPLDGVVTQVDAVVGETVQPGTTLFTIADTRQMWLMTNFHQDDVGRVRVGSTIAFESDSSGSHAEGTVAWISPTIDDRTRTVSVRANIESDGETLKNNTFGKASVLLRAEKNAIVVPKQAIQSTADATFVFVRDKNFFRPDVPLYFHVRQVRIGTSDETHVELLAGVLPGEVIVTKGSTSILAQLLKSNLGAGCGCCEE
jgi:cobalt-zinc-cadmium efflux system membrane fusion protein